MNQDYFLVLWDKENKMYVPQAGIWKNNEAGWISAKEYLKKDKGVEVVKVKFVQVFETE